MYKVDVDETLCRIIKLFYWFGIWQNDEESAYRKMGKKLFHFLELIFMFIFVLLCTFLSDDNTQSIFLVEIDVVMAVLIIKLSYLLWRKDEILNFLYDPTVTHCIVDSHESMEVNKKISKITKFSRAYSFALAIAYITVILASLPIFTNERLLPMFIRFDLLSDYDTLFYWMTYVCVSCGCFPFILFNSLMPFIWYMMFNYSIEYEILGNQFRCLGKKRKEKQVGRNSRLNDRHFFLNDLINLIRAHQNLFEYEVVKATFIPKQLKIFIITVGRLNASDHASLRYF